MAEANAAKHVEITILINGRGSGTSTGQGANHINTDVLAIEPEGGGSIITLDSGANQKVKVGYVGVLLADEPGKALKGGNFTIIEIHEKTSIALCALSPSEASKSNGAKISADTSVDSRKSKREPTAAKPGHQLQQAEE